MTEKILEIMSEIKIIAVFNIKEEFKDELLIAFKNVVDETRKEEGVISYELHQDLKKPLTFVMLEVWKSNEAILKHNETPHFKKLLEDVKGKITSFTVETIEKVY